MRHEPSISGQSLGYVSSGRFAADIERDSAFAERRRAHICFRHGLPYRGRRHMRRALQLWDLFRYRYERIVQ